MRKNIIITLLVIGIWSLVICATAQAMHFEGGGVDIKMVPNSGSSINLEGGGVKIQDIKGYPVGMDFEGSGVKIGLGLPYLLGAMGLPGPVGDTGLIQQTQIFRNTTDPGSYMRLTWAYKLGSGVDQADIWRMKGEAEVPEGDYNDASGWVKIWTTAVGETEYIDDNIDPPAVGDGYNAYYRVVPKDTFSSDVFALYNNTRTVAKIDLSLSSGEFFLASIPLYAGPVDESMRGQVGNDKFYFYPQSGTGLGGFKYENDALVGTPFDLVPGKGLWIENSSTADHTITFAGSIETYNYREIATMDLTGNSIPYPLNSADFNAYDGDYIYPQSGTGLAGFKYQGGGWVGTFTLNTGAGCWYEHAGTRYWIIDLKNGVSITEMTP